MSICNVIFLLLLPSLTSATLASAKVCGQKTGYRWCLDKPEKSQARTVLYYFHGNGGDERAWGSLPHHNSMTTSWGHREVDAPAVLAISFGKTWFLRQHQTLTQFTNTIVPDLERTLGLQPTRRVLLGESMGGFNAFQVYAYAPQAFERFVISCAAILPFPPDAPTTEVAEYIDRHEPYVIPKLVYKWKEKLSRAYPTRQLWTAHDPFLLARAQGRSSPHLMLISGDRDAFGVHESALRLSEQLATVGAPVAFHTVPGGAHCDPSPHSLKQLVEFVAGRIP